MTTVETETKILVQAASEDEAKEKRGISSSQVKWMLPIELAAISVRLGFNWNSPCGITRIEL